MVSIIFFADHSEEPVLWVPPQSEAFTVEVGEGVRVVRSRSVKSAIEGALPYVVFAILIVLGPVLDVIANGWMVVGPILFIQWIIFGHRNQMVIFDLDENKLTRKRNGKIFFPFTRVWRGLNLGRVQFDHNVRDREHSSSSADAVADTWTTSHPGVDMIVPTDSGDIVAIFFEYGPNPQLHKSLILDLLDNLGVPQEIYLVPEAETSATEDVPRKHDDADDGYSLVENKNGETNSGAFWSFDGQNSEELP